MSTTLTSAGLNVPLTPNCDALLITSAISGGGRAHARLDVTAPTLAHFLSHPCPLPDARS